VSLEIVSSTSNLRSRRNWKGVGLVVGEDENMKKKEEEVEARRRGQKKVANRRSLSLD
jgi:hypothetical protein